MQEEIKYIIKNSALGIVLVAQSEKGLCAVLIADNHLVLVGELQTYFPKAYLVQANEQLEKLASKVAMFIENPKADLDVSLDIRGTDFQKKVWAALQNIPSGKTASYTDIAYNLKCPKAVRAVANACAANALAVVIPCHRTIGKNGKLSGYRWGVEVKKKLLEIEINSQLTGFLPSHLWAAKPVLFSLRRESPLALSVERKNCSKSAGHNFPTLNHEGDKGNILIPQSFLNMKIVSFLVFQKRIFFF